MTKGREKRALSLLLAFAMVLALLPGLGLEAQAAEEKEIVIYHTNDIHGRGIGDPATETVDDKEVPREEGKIGYARYKTILDEAREDGENVLVLDAGDTLHGLNFVNISKGSNAIKLMNAVGTEAMVLGNHEFNYGSEELENIVKEADFPVLGANITREGTNDKPYQERFIKEVAGVKVGIFGIVTPETKVKAHPDNTEGLDFALTVDENAKVAQEQIDALKEEGADVIIGLFHVGVDSESEVTTDKIAEQLEGVDAIIDGHSHTELPEGMMVNDILICQTGEYFNNIGKTTLSFDENNELVDRETEFITFAEARDVEEDPEIVKMIEDMEAVNAEKLDRVVGKTTVTLDGERGQVRTGETNLGNLITDSMIAKDEVVDVALMNGGGIRASIDEGDITYGEVLTVLPFGNQMTVIEVTGQQIVDALTFGVDAYPETAGKFPHIGGMTFDIYQDEAGNKVYNVEVGGEPIDLDATYNLATNDFMAVGGDGYTMFEGAHQVALYASLEEIVVEYITEHGTVSPEVEGRVEEITDLTDDDIYYPSSDASDDDDTDVTEVYRIAGDNRIETAIEIAREMFPEGAETVVLANDVASVDALTVAPLADILEAPVLLTGAKDLNPAVAEAIEELGAEEVIIIGGENSVSESIEEGFGDGIEVERIQGDNRYETAAEIAEEVLELGESEEAIVVNGIYADALSAANLATRIDAPILLVDEDAVPEATAEVIDDVETVRVIGGENTISNKVFAELDASERIAGSNRYETAVQVARLAAPEADSFYFAQGGVYVDALTIAPHLAATDSVLLLVGQNFLPVEVSDYLADKDMDSYAIIGGENTISKQVEEKILEVAN